MDMSWGDFGFRFLSFAVVLLAGGLFLFFCVWGVHPLIDGFTLRVMLVTQEIGDIKHY